MMKKCPTYEIIYTQCTRMRTKYTESRYNSVLQNNNITASDGSKVSTYRTMMRRVNLTTRGVKKGGALYRPTSHSDYLRMHTLRRIL